MLCSGAFLPPAVGRARDHLSAVLGHTGAVGSGLTGAVEIHRSRLGQDSGTLTPLLKRLEKQAYVEHWCDPDDDRCTLAALTADGASLRTRAECIPEAMAGAIRR